MRFYNIADEWKLFRGFSDMVNSTGGQATVTVNNRANLDSINDAVLKEFKRKRISLTRVIRTDADEFGVCRVAELFVPDEFLDNQGFESGDEFAPNIGVARSEMVSAKSSFVISFLEAGNVALALERVLRDKQTKRIVQFGRFYLNPERWTM